MVSACIYRGHVILIWMRQQTYSLSEQLPQLNILVYKCIHYIKILAEPLIA
jgi:hypothetical protein